MAHHRARLLRPWPHEMFFPGQVACLDEELNIVFYDKTVWPTLDWVGQNRIINLHRPFLTIEEATYMALA